MKKHHFWGHVYELEWINMYYGPYVSTFSLDMRY